MEVTQLFVNYNNNNLTLKRNSTEWIFRVTYGFFVLALQKAAERLSLNISVT